MQNYLVTKLLFLGTWTCIFVSLVCYRKG